MLRVYKNRGAEFIRNRMRDITETGKKGGGAAATVAALLQGKTIAGKKKAAADENKHFSFLYTLSTVVSLSLSQSCLRPQYLAMTRSMSRPGAAGLRKRRSGSPMAAQSGLR